MSKKKTTETTTSEKSRGGKKPQYNATALMAGGIIASGTVLLALLDGGFTRLVFQAITGTSAYFIHDITVNDLPIHLQDQAVDLPAADCEQEKLEMQLSNIMAGVAVAADPIIGGVLLLLAIGGHSVLDERRTKEINLMAEKFSEALQKLEGQRAVVRA